MLASGEAIYTEQENRLMMAIKEEQTSEYYSPRQIAKILGISRKKVYRLMKAGWIEFIYIGHDKRISPEEKERICTKGIRTT